MQTKIKSVSVFGLGKLGHPLAATLVQRGFNVVGIDPDKNIGHMDQVIETDASFFAVPTPSQPDGSFSSKYLVEAMHALALALLAAGKQTHIFVCCSTTTPGDCESLMDMIADTMGEGFGFCYNPQFIALGEVEKGLLEPDLVLIGESDQPSADALEAFYKDYNTNKPPICRMPLVSAELTKIALNSYITTKISFTNQIRMIAERIGANDHLVLNALGKDPRIGSKYLQPGWAYGGPCFPRDNRLLMHTAARVGISAPLASAADQVNNLTKRDLLERVQATGLKTVVILGLAYKPGTDIIEESTGLYLAVQLSNLGYRVIVDDPVVSLNQFENLTKLEDLISMRDALVVVCCPWPEYLNLEVPLKVISPYVAIQA